MACHAVMSQLESRNINQTDLFFISTIMYIFLSSCLVHNDVFCQIVVEGGSEGREEGAKRKENEVTDEIALTAVWSCMRLQCAEASSLSRQVMGSSDWGADSYSVVHNIDEGRRLDMLIRSLSLHSTPHPQSDSTHGPHLFHDITSSISLHIVNSSPLNTK